MSERLRICWKAPARKLFLAACLLTSLTLFAQDDDFSDMSLEDLLNVEVSVASSGDKAETIIETPAIVGRFNRTDLEKMGIRNIKDLLSFFPGFVSMEAGIGTSPVMVRGLVDAFDQKVLFLIDDVPYFQPSHSISGLLGVPFEAISHVEVIRGPGAVIYGTNASGGVINVITKKKGESSLAISGGSDSLFNGGGYIRHDFNEDTGIFLTFETQSEDGYDAPYNNTPSPPFFNPRPATGGTITKAEEYTSAMIRFNYKRFNASLQFQDDERDGLAGVGTIENVSRLEGKGNMIHLDYTINNDRMNIKFYGDRHNYYLNLPVDRSSAGFTQTGGFRFANGGDDNWRLRAGIQANFKLSENFSILSGGEFETRSAGEYQQFDASGTTIAVPFQKSEVDEKSLFAQLDFKAGDWRFLVGGRWTDNEFAGDDITPRAAIVYKLNDANSLKLLYSTGFNSPNFLQQRINVPNVIVGDESLVAETVTDLDFAYSFNKGNTLFVANAYYLKAENFIGRGPKPGQAGNFYFNTDEFTRTGIELDFQKVISAHRVFANLAYQDEANEVIADDTTALFAPQVTTVLGYSYRIGAADDNMNHSVGGSIRYIGDRGVADAQTLVNLNYELKVNAFRLFITAQNLLDEDRVNPDVQDFVAIREIPGGKGSTFLGGAKFTF